MIEGHEMNIKAQWEMTRAIAFNVAKFGNSDPKRFPRKLEQFWPFSWDPQASSHQNTWDRIRDYKERVAKLKNKDG